MSGFVVKRDSGLFIGDVDVAPASGTIKITENGEYDVGRYATADVDVAGYEVQSDSSGYTYTEYEPIVTTPLDMHIREHANITHIGNRACYANSVVENVYIPNSIIEIEGHPLSNTHYGEIVGAFAYCIKLKHVYGNLKAIRNCAFTGCEQLQSCDSLSNNITIVGSYAFAGCRQLSSNIYTHNFGFFDEYAFDGCLGISSIKILGINDGYTPQIYKGAFRGVLPQRLIINASNTTDNFNIYSEIFSSSDEVRLNAFALLSDNIVFEQDSFLCRSLKIDHIYTHLNSSDFATWLSNLNDRYLAEAINDTLINGTITYDYTGDGSEL